MLKIFFVKYDEAFFLLFFIFYFCYLMAFSALFSSAITILGHASKQLFEQTRKDKKGNG